MVRSVETRWNSLAEAIQRAVYLRPALKLLLSSSKYSKKGRNGLERFKHSDDEWTLLDQLGDLLEVRRRYLRL